MDQRLEEACHSGDLDMLHSLLLEDKLLLHTLSITATIFDNPLHIAASLGHTEFAEELIIRNPDLASELNSRGLSALHLASARGHLSIVKPLISKVGSHLCLLKDKDGRLPVHSAATKGRINILEELINACPESARALTYQKESILHLAVQFNSFETVEYLVEKLGVGGEINNELLNLKDDKGNTILHHAVARRQLQTVKLLVYKTRMEVNTRNLKGLTPLDVLLELPSEHGDLALSEVIRAAGGKTTEDHEEQQQTPPHSSPIDDFMAPPKAASLRKRSKKRSKIEDTYTPGTLIVVATLIATITFQAGLSPPGGFTQPGVSDPNSSSTPSPAVMPVFGSKLSLFLVFDVIGLFTSLTIILLIICWMPKKRKRMMMILVWIIWLSVFSTGLAFTAAFSDIYQDSEYLSVFLIRGWTWVFRVFILFLCFKFCRHLLRMVGWCNKEGDQEATSDDHVKQMGVLLFLGRVVVLMVILMFVVVVAIVNIVVFVVWDLRISLEDLYLKVRDHLV